MDNFRQKHADKFRFALVGGANTALDFILLFLFVNLGVNKIVANYFSTGISLIFSFFANKSFTFKNKTGNAKKQFGIFLLVTITGLWVLQPLIIWAVTSILDSYVSNESALLFIAKLIATVASLVWNYFLYSRLVFKKATN
jgi:putative flippase GtrA